MYAFSAPETIRALKRKFMLASSSPPLTMLALFGIALSKMSGQATVILSATICKGRCGRTPWQHRAVRHNSAYNSEMRVGINAVVNSVTEQYNVYLQGKSCATGETYCLGCVRISRELSPYFASWICNWCACIYCRRILFLAMCL